MLIRFLNSSILTLILLRFVRGTPVVRTSEQNLENVRLAKSKEMLSYMNVTADPCMDFYNFACGNWITLNPASKQRYETNVFQNTKEEMGSKILNLLLEENNSDRKIDENVKNFYESCVTTSKVIVVYKEKLKEIISEFGQMPVLEGNKWRRTNFDWLATIAQIAHKYDINIILGYKIMSDLEENTKNRLFLSHPDFPLKTLAMYVDKKNEAYRLNYQEVIAKNLKQFLDLHTDVAETTAKEILDFEIALVNCTKRYTIQGKELQFSTTVDKLHALHAPDLDIKRLLELSLGFIPTGKIFVKNPGYQTGLVDVMKKTPKRVVANFIFYNLLTHFFLPVHKTQIDINSKCMDKTKQHFSNVLDNMVYRKYNTDETEKALQNIFEKLKFAFQNSLESGKYSWIHENTRKLAVQKLKAMKLEINSYENLNFTAEYDQLRLNRTDYIENVKGIFALNAANTRAKLDEALQTFYNGADMSFGPRYILTENLIKIPVATLQPQHFWSSSFPQAVNFGRLGFLIAHEMIHGFDDEGRTFDTSGNDRDWWDDVSAQVFKNRTTCFRNQYRNYANTNQIARKSHLQSENIADNGGVRLTYDSFMKWYTNALADHKDMQMESLPNFSYNQKQLFFISFAQLWCYDILPSYRSIKMSTDSHEPGNLRVIGSLSNFDEFSNAFNCSPNSGMNPSNKCEIF